MSQSVLTDGCSAMVTGDFQFNIVFETYDFIKNVIKTFLDTLRLTIFAILLTIKRNK